MQTFQTLTQASNNRKKTTKSQSIGNIFFTSTANQQTPQQLNPNIFIKDGIPNSSSISKYINGSFQNSSINQRSLFQKVQMIGMLPGSSIPPNSPQPSKTLINSNSHELIHKDQLISSALNLQNNLSSNNSIDKAQKILSKYVKDIPISGQQLTYSTTSTLSFDDPLSQQLSVCKKSSSPALTKFKDMIGAKRPSQQQIHQPNQKDILSINSEYNQNLNPDNNHKPNKEIFSSTPKPSKSVQTQKLEQRQSNFNSIIPFQTQIRNNFIDAELNLSKENSNLQTLLIEQQQLLSQLELVNHKIEQQRQKKENSNKFSATQDAIEKQKNSIKENKSIKVLQNSSGVCLINNYSSQINENSGNKSNQNLHAHIRSASANDNQTNKKQQLFQSIKKRTKQKDNCIQESQNITFKIDSDSVPQNHLENSIKRNQNSYLLTQQLDSIKHRLIQLLSSLNPRNEQVSPNNQNEKQLERNHSSLNQIYLTQKEKIPEVINQSPNIQSIFEKPQPALTNFTKFDLFNTNKLNNCSTASASLLIVNQSPKKIEKDKLQFKFQNEKETYQSINLVQKQNKNFQQNNILKQ